MSIANDDAQKVLFENVTDENPVFVVDHQGSSYGWEGKVKLGEKEVTLAVFKWNYLVNVFVKE